MDKGGRTHREVEPDSANVCVVFAQTVGTDA
jgi:hypothetical protein